MELKKFKLFNFNKDGKGVEKEEMGPPNLKFFFKLLWRKFSRLISLNLAMLLIILPVVAVFLAYLWAPTTPAQENVVFSALFGIDTISENPLASLLLTVNDSQLAMPIMTPTVITVFVVSAILMITTFGWQNIGATYVLREMVTGNPVFIFSDYKYAIKKNFKQGFLLGVIDFAIIALLCFDIFYFYFVTGSFALDMMFFIVCGIAILYFFMRFYLYLMAITFDLSIKKLFKNALIFAVLGIKRNLMAALGIIALIAFNVALIMLLIPVGIIIPLILPFLYFLSFASFIIVYSAYPNIKKYMIDPYANENESPDELEGSDEYTEEQ